MKQQLSPWYNLETEYPEVAAQWDYVRNAGLTPRDVLPSSKLSVFWICDFDPSHVWQARIANRTYLQRGCPLCTRHFHVSRLAMALYYYLRKLRVPCKLEEQVWRYRVDIVIDCSVFSEQPVALELDGYYSHGSQRAAQREEEKDRYLSHHGYQVIRVKETPDIQGISRQGNTISYPLDKPGVWTDRIITYLVGLFAGTDCSVDHRQDYWQIQRIYLQERRLRSLAVQYPQIANEWSPRNPEKADSVTIGTGGKRWWACSVCGREYEASIANRVRHHSGCPYCARKRATPETCLAVTHPEIALEWDKDKNGELSPEDVLSGSEIKVWWRCPQGHSYWMYPYQRTGPSKSKCPVCAGRRVIPETSLAAQNPELARYFDLEKNMCTPDTVAPFSNSAFYWRCEEGHSWRTSANAMQRRRSDRYCVFCYQVKFRREDNLQSLNPVLASYWDAEKNGVSAQEALCASSKDYWFRCPVGHSWKARALGIHGQQREVVCPYCAGKRLSSENNLAKQSPGLAKQWHPTKNLPKTPDTVLAGSSVPVWWQCEKGHEWMSPPAKRFLRGDGCPYCSSRRVTPETSLAVCFPEVAEEWDRERNGDLTPDNVTAGSGVRVWWLCKQGHSWQASVSNRTRGHRCPVCRDRSVRHGSLAQEHPELAVQWDWERNEKPPEAYRARSNTKVWWCCSEGHIWQATPDSRVSGSGCPVCRRKRKEAARE